MAERPLDDLLYFRWYYPRSGRKSLTHKAERPLDMRAIRDGSIRAICGELSPPGIDADHGALPGAGVRYCRHCAHKEAIA